MKKNFFRFLLLGAFTLSLGFGFVACNDYDKDIKDICERLDLAEGRLDALEAAIVPSEEGDYVTNLTYDKATNSLLVEYTKSADRDIALPAVPTGNDADLPYYEENEDGSYTLWLYEDGGTELKSIVVPTFESGNINAITKIEILGWVTDYEGAIADGNLSRQDGTDPTTDPATPTEELVGNNEVKGELLTDYEDFIIDYTIVSDFTYDHDLTGLAANTDLPNTDAAPADFLHADPLSRDYLPPVTGATPNKQWLGGAHPVKQGAVTNTLAASGQGILIEVYPATADLTAVKFAIQNTLGEALPIGFGIPVAVDARLTRAASASALWFIPGADYTGTKTYTGADARKNFASEFDHDALYQLTANGQVLSDLTDFTIRTRPVASIEAPVLYVNSTVAGSEDNAITVDDDYQVLVSNVAGKQKWYDLKFDESFDESTSAGTVDDTSDSDFVEGNLGITDVVTDYYMQPASGTVDPELWALTFNKEHTQFSVGKLSDNLTLTTFDMNVYKLGVDGKVYLEVIKIHPVRDDVVTTIDLGKYLIVDADPTDATDYMSDSLHIDFNKAYASNRVLNGEDNDEATTGTAESMFTELGRYMWDTELTYEEFWKDELSTAGRGADSYVVREASYTSDGGATNIALDVTSSGPLATAGLNFFGFDEDGEYTEVMEDVRTVEVSMPYAVNAGADAAWVVNAEYSITIDILDAAGNKINVVVIKFTPVIPDPSTLFVIDKPYWTPQTQDGVLQAYYKEPATWAATEAPNEEKYDIALGLYDLDAMNAAAAVTGGNGNGGFLSFASGINWRILSTTPALPSTAAGTLNQYVEYTQTSATSATTPPLDMIFQLYGQFFPAGFTETAATGDLDGDGAIGATADIVATDVVRLLDPTNPALAAVPYDFNAYGGAVKDWVGDGPNTVLTMAPQTGYEYLELYPYDDAVLEKSGFKIRIMSALKEGTIEAVEDAIVLTPVGVGALAYARLDKTDIHGYKYNRLAGDYDLFQIWDDALAIAVYDYKYILKVEFMNAPGTEGHYQIIDADGNATRSAIAPTATGEEGWLKIKPSSTTNKTVTKIRVRVTDRFGKVKQVDLDMTLNAASTGVR